MVGVEKMRDTELGARYNSRSGGIAIVWRYNRVHSVKSHVTTIQ